MPEKKTKISVTKKPDVLLLFAMGGRSLAFYELRELSLLLAHYAPEKATTDDLVLRNALYHHPDVETANGNLFECSNVDLARIAMSFFEDDAMKPLCLRIARTLPMKTTDGAVLLDRLSRDLRNSLFVQDFVQHKQYHDVLYREFSDAYAMNLPYRFLLDHDYAEWFKTLSPDLLSVCINKTVPLILSEFLDGCPLLAAAMPMFKKLHPRAQFPLVDLLIFMGRLDEAKRCLKQIPQTDENAHLTRAAWLQLIQGDADESVKLYKHALDDLRRTGGSSIYFMAVTGVFYIYALLKNGAYNAIGEAHYESNLAAANCPYASSYRILYEYTGHVLRNSDESFQNPCETATDRFGMFNAAIVSFWLYNGQTDEPLQDSVDDLLERAQTVGFEWIAAELTELKQRLKTDWLPDETAAETSRRVVPLVDCVKILPAWTVNTNTVKELISNFNGINATRATWMVSISPENPTEVHLELFEQHVTKKHHWTRGRRIHLDKLKRDVLSQGHWPLSFTACDVQVASILLQLDIAGFWETNGRGDLESLTPNDALLLLKGSPLLFWADDTGQDPVRVVLDEPYITIRRDAENHRVTLSVFPNVKPNQMLSAVRFDDNTLHLFQFNQIHKRIHHEIHGALTIPEQAFSRMTELCERLASVMVLQSDDGLEHLNIDTVNVAEPAIVMRLERTHKGLMVELLCQPFGRDSGLQRPDDECRIIVTHEHGQVVKKVRDMQAETALIDRVLTTCDTLTPNMLVSPYQWLIEQGETVFQFMMQVRDITDFCTILWRHDRKFSMSRRISFGDVNLNVQRTSNWLEVDGRVTVDENLSLSFQKLLELTRAQSGNFIALEDGEIVALADDFRAALDDFNAIAQGMRKGQQLYSPLALPALRLLLESFETVSASDEWKEQVRRMDAARIMKIAAPAHLREKTRLRDYQLEGYRWLIRLDAWGAGACLADDMGLGKTLQTIAFMMSKAQEGPMLVVAPTSVCANWLDEFAKFAPSMKVMLFGQGNRNEMIASMGANMTLVTSYGLLQSQIECFQGIHWRVVVLDEAQAIKNYQAKRSQAVMKLDAQFRIATTGTPIENNLGELWTLFEFITPGLLGSRKAFQERFMGTAERADSDSDKLSQLNALIHPFLLRRKKDDVLRELPAKTEVQLRVELSETERAFYEAIRQSLLAQLEGQADGNSAQQRIRILAAITKLRQAACNPLLIDPNTTVQSAKLAAFRELVTELVGSGHKTLVFSQFVKHLDIIRPCLRELNITYEYLDGTTPPREREEAVRNFQAGLSDLFLISLRAGGLGLNLTRADYVIILDPWWNPAVEDQAADRAHRLGQERPVTIYRIIAKDTIEDKIIELHHQKQDLAVKLLDGTDTATSISADDLLKLLQSRE